MLKIQMVAEKELFTPRLGPMAGLKVDAEDAISSLSYENSPPVRAYRSIARSAGNKTKAIAAT